MGRWQKLIEELLQKLGRLTPGGGSLFHDEIDELLREVEEIVERAESVEVLETPKLRQREFEFGLRLVLVERIQREPSN